MGTVKTGTVHLVKMHKHKPGICRALYNSCTLYTEYRGRKYIPWNNFIRRV